MNIYERDRIRQILLTETYELTKADTRLSLDLRELGKYLKLDGSEVEKAYYFLKDEGLLKPYGAGYTVMITHYGIKVVEATKRQINLEEEKEFNSTEIYQLNAMLNDIKTHLRNVSLGQEVLYNRIDEAFEKSKKTDKNKWKSYFKEQVVNWAVKKAIDESAVAILERIVQ